MTEGTTWVYQAVAPDENRPATGIQANAPDEITIKVVSVKSSKDSATITTEESFRKGTKTAVHSCNKGSLTIDPASFFWAGEPGGGMQIELTKLRRTGKSYPGIKDFKKGESWLEEIKATAERKAAPDTNAKIHSGEVEMEREVSIGQLEPVATAGDDVRAFRVEIGLSGRGRLEGVKGGEREMAAGAKALLWFAPNVGLIKVINRFNEAWLLKL